MISSIQTNSCAYFKRGLKPRIVNETLRIVNALPNFQKKHPLLNRYKHKSKSQMMKKNFHDLYYMNTQSNFPAKSCSFGERNRMIYEN